MVALQHVVAFPEGCSLGVRLAVRRGSLDESVWQNLLAGHAGGDPRLAPGGDDLKFTVRWPDGSEATNLDRGFARLGASCRPARTSGAR
ncbi:hypothetical protein [Actinomadura sp. 9N215]|uniref:hypothetical protein n=1 Tax=Actinomadura sp. 9N215 TaxID=3375150 RepID=UPI0037AEC12C